MKFILDTNQFKHEEYETLISVIRDIENIEKFIQKLDDENYEFTDDISLEISNFYNIANPSYMYCYYTFNNEDKPIVKQLCKLLLTRKKDDLQSLIKHTGLAVINNE